MTDQLRLGLEEAPKAERTGALRHHHVRSHQTAAEALEGEQRAARGDRRVLAVFEHCLPGDRLTPSQVHGLMKDDTGTRAPLLTSVRRALTNLTAAGLLVHHPEDRALGPHGSKESKWSLPS